MDLDSTILLTRVVQAYLGVGIGCAAFQLVRAFWS